MPNFDRLAKLARKHFSLSHDEARHSFISYHVAAHRSIGDAALQAGNFEDIVKRHYLNTHTQNEGGHFFLIVPDPSVQTPTPIFPRPPIQPNDWFRGLPSEANS